VALSSGVGLGKGRTPIRRGLDYVNTISWGYERCAVAHGNRGAPTPCSGMTKAYQRAARLDDKSGLKAASNPSIHYYPAEWTARTKKQRHPYLKEVNDRFCAQHLGEGCAGQSLPLMSEGSLKGVIRPVCSRLEQRDADALVRSGRLGAE